MAFIETTPPDAAEGVVAAMYLRQQHAWGYVPNYAKVFCHRPEVLARWGQLLAEIRRPMDKRRFELVTFAAAYALDNTACALVHGKALDGVLQRRAGLRDRCRALRRHPQRGRAGHGRVRTADRDRRHRAPRKPRRQRSGRMATTTPRSSTSPPRPPAGHSGPSCSMRWACWRTHRASRSTSRCAAR